MNAFRADTMIDVSESMNKHAELASPKGEKNYLS